MDPRIHAHPTRKHQTQRPDQVVCQPGAVAVDTKPKLDDGGGQYSCSQCAGRVTTNAKTRNPDTVPNKTAPYLRIEDNNAAMAWPASQSTCSTPAKTSRSAPPAHDKSYGRRNPSEKTISMIKDKGGLKAGWCRAFGLAAHTIGVLALAIAHNVKETIGIERTQTQNPPLRPGPRTSSRPAGTSSPTASPPGHRPTRHTARTRRRQ